MPKKTIFRKSLLGKILRAGALLAILVLVGCRAVIASSTTPEPTATPTATLSPLPAPTNTLVPTETQTPSPTPELLYDIYDINSFPAGMKAIVADPMKATSEQQTAYQAFLDRQREMFFEKQGIKDVVDKMVASGKIYPEQAVLWGMAYWESMQTEHGVIVLGPEDLKQAKAIEDGYREAMTESWREEIIVNGATKIFAFGYSWFDYEVYGILVGVGGLDKTDYRFPIVAVQDKNGLWSLAVRSLIFEDIVIPKGTLCFRSNTPYPGTPFLLEEDAPFGVPIGNAATETALFEDFGQQISISSTTIAYRDWRSSYMIRHLPELGQQYDVDCTFPYPDTFMAGGLVKSTIKILYPGLPFPPLE